MIEAKTLPQIVDMGRDEIAELLSRINFGHLGVCKENRPYVVPIHFAYGRPGIYFYTTEGMKTPPIPSHPPFFLQF